MEKVFNAAGGRTDSAEASFFDLMSGQLGGNFRHEADGTLTVIDGAGDPSWTGDWQAHQPRGLPVQQRPPRFGTFFKGAKGRCWFGYGGTDSNGMPVEDLSGLSTEELFKRAFS